MRGAGVSIMLLVLNVVAVMVGLMNVHEYLGKHE